MSTLGYSIAVAGQQNGSKLEVCWLGLLFHAYTNNIIIVIVISQMRRMYGIYCTEARGDEVMRSI